MRVPRLLGGAEGKEQGCRRVPLETPRGGGELDPPVCGCDRKSQKQPFLRGTSHC